MLLTRRTTDSPTAERASAAVLRRALACKAVSLAADSVGSLGECDYREAYLASLPIDSLMRGEDDNVSLDGYRLQLARLRSSSEGSVSEMAYELRRLAESYRHVYGLDRKFKI